MFAVTGQRWARSDVATTQTCEHCGSHVTTDFARTFGDAQHTVHRCLGCDTFGRISSGSAAGQLVRGDLTTDGGGR